MTARPQGDQLLNGREEADRLGLDESTVSKARQDPTHPANADPRTSAGTLGRISLTLVPADAIDEWWQARPKRQRGRRPDLVHLAAAARGEAIPDGSRERLAGRGLLDGEGRVTEAGMAALERTAGDGAEEAT